MKIAPLPTLLILALLLAWPASAQPADGLTLYFCRDGQAVAVSRPGTLAGEPQADAATLLRALLAGPTARERDRGLASALPPGGELAAVAVAGDEATVDLRLPGPFLLEELDAYRSDAIVEQIVKTLHPLGLHHVHVRAEDEAGQPRPLSSFLPQPAVPSPTMPANDDDAPAVPGPPGPLSGPGGPQGALSGKTVWLSAGHGWYWSETLNRWNTQRPNTFGLVEDFANAEAVNYYLARYLQNAGAEVWFVRERALTEQEVIVDNDAGAPAYVETGAWAASGSPGYAGGSYRYAMTRASSTATATWTPDLPAAGWYPVWAWYRHGTNRPTDARYEIHHAGGLAEVHISQEVHGLTWRYLGEFYFEAGTAGRVTLVNASADPGQAVIADAVRFGGGLGSIPSPVNTTSGEPRWEEAAQTWAQYQGAPPEVYDNDVTARPLYAEWETARGYPGEAETAVYVSWHTNAGGGTGTESYIHDTEPTTGSAELQDWVHAELIDDLRREWDSGWVNRGQKSADFGELRELSTIPGLLLEVAFHDTESPGDADDLREPHFRQIAARAVYQGIVKYHAAREGTAVHLLPEPPQRLLARTAGPGQVTLSWLPSAQGQAATAYRVYHSSDGRAFDGGLGTTDPGLTLDGLTPGSLHFFRVTARNAGGESFPSPVVAVRTPASASSVDLLIVDGFDRLDQAALVPQWESPALGTARRMFLERMNSYDYAVEHGLALAACSSGWAFDGAVNEAVAAGDVALAAYPAVAWFAGEDAAADAALDDAERAALAAYLDSGGRLLISGSEIGYDLVEHGRDPDFFRTYLRAEYLAGDAGSYEFAGTATGPLAGLAGAFDDGSQGNYDVDRPDRLAPGLGATAVLSYSTGAAAAIACDAGFRVLYFGFPLEAVVGDDARAALFCAAAGYLLDESQAAGSQRLINPGFEGGPAQSAWQVQATDGQPVLVEGADLPAGVAPYAGEWLAWLSGHTPGLTGTVALTQVVALPAGEPTATLSLAWLAHHEPASRYGAQPPSSVPLSQEDHADPEGPSTPTGTLAVSLYDLSGTLQAELLTISQPAVTGTWQVPHLALGAYAGQTVQLALRAGGDTAFFVDDVQLTTSGPPGPDEFRGLWVDAYHPGLKNRRQIDELVETALAGSFNALVVQVRRRGDTYYPSDLDPWAPDADPAFDALANLIDAAHGAGLEVHAWATTLAIWGGTVPPESPEHTFNRHGPGATGRDYWLMTSYAGEERISGLDGPGPLEERAGSIYYLDPGHPDVVDYTVAVYAELARRYDLDGLHLDRVRYPDVGGLYCQNEPLWYCQDWGYNPLAVARFQVRTGRQDVPEPLDEAWVQWRRDQVTALVRKIYLTVTAIDPGLRVSAAVSTSGAPPSDAYPWQTRTPYIHQLQDWRAWLEEGSLDLALPMTYRDEDVYSGQFTRWIAWQLDHQYSRGVVVGSGLYLNAVEDSLAQWRRARRPSALGNRALGLCGYSYASPSDTATPRRDFVNAAVSEVFTRSASTPAIPWKEDPVQGHLMGRLLQVPACLDLDGYPLALRGPLSRTLWTDGSGWFGAIDLPPGTYQLAVEVVTPSLTLSLPVQVDAGVVTEQEIHLPACGNHRLYLPLVLRSTE